MLLRSPHTLAAALALCAIPLSAQQTWIVDKSGGPGAQFTEIESAVAAAAPGDTILVRAGNYFPFRVAKPLRILGDDGVVVAGGFGISGLPPGLPVAVRNLELTIGHPAVHIGLQLTDNAAPVHLDAIRVTSTLTPDDGVIRDCSFASLSRCEITGVIALAIARSAVQIAGSQLRASSATSAGFALRCTEASVEVGATTVEGSNQVFVTTASSAIDLRSGTLTIGAASAVRAGTGPSQTPLPAIATAGGTLIIDPSATIAPAFGAPAISGPAAVQSRVVLAANTTGKVGGTFAGQAFAPEASVMTTFLGLPAPPIATPFGTLWVAPPLLIVDVGVVPASGMRAFSFGVPAAVPPGAAITTQSITLHDGVLYLGTPSTAVLAPPSF